MPAPSDSSRHRILNKSVRENSDPYAGGYRKAIASHIAARDHRWDEATPLTGESALTQADLDAIRPQSDAERVARDEEFARYLSESDERDDDEPIGWPSILCLCAAVVLFLGLVVATCVVIVRAVQ